jgi:hypothetical protein
MQNLNMNGTADRSCKPNGRKLAKVHFSAWGKTTEHPQAMGEFQDKFAALPDRALDSGPSITCFQTVVDLFIPDHDVFHALGLELSGFRVVIAADPDDAVFGHAVMVLEPDLLAFGRDAADQAKTHNTPADLRGAGKLWRYTNLIADDLDGKSNRQTVVDPMRRTKLTGRIHKNHPLVVIDFPNRENYRPGIFFPLYDFGNGEKAVSC